MVSKVIFRLLKRLYNHDNYVCKVRSVNMKLIIVIIFTKISHAMTHFVFLEDDKKSALKGREVKVAATRSKVTKNIIENITPKHITSLCLNLKR